MAFGTLKADTLTHSTAGSLDTNFVVNGSAKAWVKFNPSVVVSDSFNNSSVTDNAVGQFTVARTNGMNNTGYATQVNGDWTVGTDSGLAIHSVDNTTITGTQTRCAFYNSSFSQYDVDGMAVTIQGDLA